MSMQLKIVGSSSQGNAYILKDAHQSLVIEAGVSFANIQKALDYQLLDCQGVLVSHEHKDHCREVNKFLCSHINVFMSLGTAQALAIEKSNSVVVIKELQEYKIGDFKVLPFKVQHDAKEPLGFLINHKECGNVLFATDTFYLRYTFEHLNNIMIECNYDEDILLNNVQKGVVSKVVSDRVKRSHLSLSSCKEVLKANDLSEVNNIVLLHLSADNSDKSKFKREIEELTMKKVTIADRDIVIDFNKGIF